MLNVSQSRCMDGIEKRDETIVWRLSKSDPVRMSMVFSCEAIFFFPAWWWRSNCTQYYDEREFPNELCSFLSVRWSPSHVRSLPLRAIIYGCMVHWRAKHKQRICIFGLTCISLNISTHTHAHAHIRILFGMTRIASAECVLCQAFQCISCFPFSSNHVRFRMPCLYL